MQRRTDSIIRCAPAADYSDKEGYGVTLSLVGTVLTATLSASATVPWDAIIVEGGTTTSGISIAVLGGTPGSVDVKVTGAVNRGSKLIQSNDGTAVVDSGAGARVQIGVLNETSVSGDLREVFLRSPLTLS